jgi:hypothetical protein
MPNAKEKYVLQYNKLGLVVPPQAMDTPLGFLTNLFVFVIPFAVLAGHTHWPFPPMLLHGAPTFRAFEAAGVMSENKIAETEVLLLIHLIVRLALFPGFIKKYVSYFSEDDPPPLELINGWPRQIIGMFKFGLFTLALPLVWGVIAAAIHYLSSKFVFCTLCLLGVGISFLTEGLMDLCLYLTLRRKYWREGS